MPDTVMCVKTEKLIISVGLCSCLNEALMLNQGYTAHTNILALQATSLNGLLDPDSPRLAMAKGTYCFLDYD